MTTRGEGIYVGKVMHKRLRPKVHRLDYAVFSILVDVDQLPELGRKLTFFSHNRFNLFSIFERDHGDGGNLKSHLARTARRVPGTGGAERFLMLCYPRILGYAFNPLTVYYGVDGNGRTVITIYEVNNTFGERHTYALSASEDCSGIIRQDCDKALHVSPFNTVSGRYHFRTSLPADHATVAIVLKDDAGPLLSARFSGRLRPLSDRSLAGLFVTHGFMTAKVWLAIRYEALKLWSKGLRVTGKPPAPATGLTTDRSDRSDMAA